MNVGERKLLNEHKDISSKKWKIVYRASTHGDSATNFHQKCDNIAPVLVVIQSKSYNHVFGGFSHFPFESTSGTWTKDPQFRNWLFKVRLVNEVEIFFFGHKISSKEGKFCCCVLETKMEV